MAGRADHIQPDNTGRYGYRLVRMLCGRTNGGALVTDYFKCEKTRCQGNEYGRCRVLNEPIEGKPCPFYKTYYRLVTELNALAMNDWAAYHKAQQEGDND